MNWWVLFGCKLTGWNSDVLARKPPIQRKVG